MAVITDIMMSVTEMLMNGGDMVEFFLSYYQVNMTVAQIPRLKQFSNVPKQFVEKRGRNITL